MSVSLSPKTVLFFTGLSGAGKSTLAEYTEKKLGKHKVKILDGDAVRKRFNNDLPHGEKGLQANANRMVDLALEHFREGTEYVITAFVFPKKIYRTMVKERFERENIRFVEIWIKASVEACAKRDPKGLYHKQKSDDSIRLAGINETYDSPERPTITVNTELSTVSECSQKILSYLDKKTP